MSGGGEGEVTVESTPTWVVSIVCTVIVLISLAAERLIHFTGKYLKRTNKKPLFQALQKIKEELMLVGFISLLLTVCQGKIGRLCISKNLASKWLPCAKEDGGVSNNTHSHSSTATVLVHQTWRHLLSEGTDFGHCQKMGKVPVLSVTALHHLHIFIFVLAAVHVTTCALTILFGGIKIRQWQYWEESIKRKTSDPENDGNNNVTMIELHEFIKNRSRAVHYRSLGWLQAFFKQFYGSVTESDYMAMRKGFIMTHCKTNPNFDFHKYMVRAFESDFKKVVGISWFLWLFVVVFLFLNVNGYHAYFWIAFIPLILNLGVGTKLEHIIIQLARQVAQRHSVVVGSNVEIRPSDDHFWFHKPRIVLLLIHIILFQNSFELAFFFWIWVQYGFDSCIMGSIGYSVPRLVIAVFVQFLCSYSTLPLYAIVTQMGSSFNKAIFEDHIQEGLIEWAHKAKKTATTVTTVRGFAKRTRSMPAIRLYEKGPSQESTTFHAFQKDKSATLSEKPSTNFHDDHDQVSNSGEIELEKLQET